MKITRTIGTVSISDSEENLKENVFYNGVEDERDCVLYDGETLHSYEWTGNHFLYRQNEVGIEEGILFSNIDAKYVFDSRNKRVYIEATNPKDDSVVGSIYSHEIEESFDLIAYSKGILP